MARLYDDSGGTIQRADIARMQQGEKMWGNHVPVPFHVTAGASSGTVQPPSDNLVYILDRPRVWALEVQADAPGASFTNLTIIVLFSVVTGVGQAKFLKSLGLRISNLAAEVPPVNLVVPVIPCQTMTVQIAGILWTNTAGGAAQDVRLDISAGASPYNRERNDT